MPTKTKTTKEPAKKAPKKASKTFAKQPHLKRKLQKIQKLPPSFRLFVAIHDFIEVIESDTSTAKKFSKDLKYGHLKQIHTGIKDIRITTTEDLGHERYMVINDLTKIKKRDRSDSNSFWKKRDLYKKLATEIYDRLDPQPVEAKK